MAYTKLQGRTAVNVYPANNVKVPSPSAAIISGANTSVVVAALVDNTVDFLLSGVKAGHTVYNTTTGAAARVLQVIDANTLLLSIDIFTATPNDYTIYTTDGDEGPVLYVGTGGDLTIVTVGRDEVTLTNVANGSFIPVMVYAVQATGTTCSDIIALW